VCWSSRHEVARRAGVAVFVFEEGYVRPDYITFEPGGVNGHSALSRDPADYLIPAQQAASSPQAAGASFRALAVHAIRYYLGAWSLRRDYPYYAHHRPLNPLTEGSRWIRSGVRKLYHAVADRPLRNRLSTQRGRNYYLVPLQVHCDAQVTHHSDYPSIEAFIAEVIVSFGANAPAGTELVFKHHPMDRAYHNYRKLINRLADRHAVGDRIFYLHEGHLPTLLRRARAAVMINSTVGLSAIHHRTPVKVLGHAIYDIPGLTCQKPLDAFWRAPSKVDYPLYKRFRQYLIANVLGNGNFYRRARAGGGATGVAWPLGSITAASDPARAAVLPTAASAREFGKAVAAAHARLREGNGSDAAIIEGKQPPAHGRGALNARSRNAEDLCAARDSAMAEVL
jgi:capsular polysaccharide export protein